MTSIPHKKQVITCSLGIDKDLPIFLVGKAKGNIEFTTKTLQKYHERTGGLPIKFATDQNQHPEELSELGRKLISLRDVIIERWEKKLREELSFARELDLPILINTLPAFIDNMAEAVSSLHPRPTAELYTSLASEHGGQRARLSNYRHQDLIREYQLLRWVLLDVLKENNFTCTHEENCVIHASIDEAIQEAANGFTLVVMALKEQYIATLSHDMKSPLGAISIFAEMISRKSEDEQIQKQATKIKDNTKRIQRMIDSLLDETALQTTGGLQLHFASCDANFLVHKVIAELESSDAQRIDLQTEGDCAGYWDCNYLTRAFENLISNALKYSDGGSEISITLSVDYERFIFHVHNKGPPIPVEERETIFQVFGRADAARRGDKKGWGLGLPLVRAVAEAHGGDIVVDSSELTGTTFTLDIPVDSRPYQNAPVSQKM